MTFSILAKDPASGAIGGAAATGSLCVGGWVLRGIPGVGMSASQGMSPSTLWGENVLALLKDGQAPGQALASVVAPDRGKAQRQLSVLNRVGESAVFSGERNTPQVSEREFECGIAAGNMLMNDTVIDALVDGYLGAVGPFPHRLLEALQAADAEGSDLRGLQSAAVLVLSPSRAPLTLRVDFSEEPLAALAGLLRRATSGDYAAWIENVPTLEESEKCFD